MVVSSSMMRTLYLHLTFSIGDTCKYTDILLCTFDIFMISLFKLVCFTFQRLMSVYIHCSIRICSVFNHFGYRAPDINSWNHLTWYSEDRTLQWLQALRAELNPHYIRGHEFCHREADQSTLVITRATMDRVSAAVTTRVATTSTTSSAPGSLTIPTPSELVVSGKDISSETSYQFIITDSDDDSDGALQIMSGEEVTPPKPSIQPSVPKLILKRKLKKKITKAKKEDQATVKAPKKEKKKKAIAAKSSTKAEKLVVRLPHGQQQLPFSQQLQTMAEKQAKPPSTSEASRQADNSSSDTQGEGDSAHPSSSGGKTA